MDNMPLQFRPGVTKEHASSSTSYQALTVPIEKRFRSRFEISASKPVSGMVFDNLGTILGTLRDEKLIPLIKTQIKTDIHRTYGPLEAKEFNLPTDVFETGTLTVASDSKYQFKIALNFTNQPQNTIEYQTPSFRDTLTSALAHATRLLAIPSAVLNKVQVEKPYVLIVQGIPVEDKYIGFLHSTVYSLQRDKDTGVIKVAQTNVEHGQHYWERHVEQCKQIIAKSSGEFFMLDGYYPPSKSN